MITDTPTMSLTVQDAEGDTAELTGWLLGRGTSRKPRHRHRPGEERLPHKGCAACRWTEIEIYRETAPGLCTPRYLLVKHGMSVVPGERRLTSFHWALGPYEALVAESTRTAALRPGESGRTLTGPALAALSQAAAVDPGIRDALSRPVPG